MKMSVCSLCNASSSNHLGDEYNFSSLVSSNQSIKDIFLKIAKDIEANAILKDAQFMSNIHSNDCCKNITICALCFKRFCDYERFSTGLSELKAIFKKEITDNLKQFDTKSFFVLSASNNMPETTVTTTNTENTGELEDIYERRSSNRKRKRPSRFSLNEDRKTSQDEGESFDPSKVTHFAHELSSTELDDIVSIESGTTYTCEECEKIFYKHTHLESHIRTHCGQKPFVCEICQKGFTRKASMLEHVARHKGIKEKECPICKKYFYPTSYWRHMSTVHPKKERLLFQCTRSKNCNKTFPQRFQLKLHEKSHVSYMNGEFSSNNCDETGNQPIKRLFSTSRQLRIHPNSVHKNGISSHKSIRSIVDQVALHSHSYSCQTGMSVNLSTKTTLNEETNHPNNSYELSESNVETQNGLNSYHIPSSGSITIASSDEAFIGKEVVIDIPSFNKVKDKELEYDKGIQTNQDKNNLYTLVDQKTGREFAQKNVCHDEQVIQIVQGNQEAVHLIVSSEKGREIIEHTVPIEYRSTSSISKSEHYKNFPDVINIDDICEPLWVKTTNENEPDTIVVSVDSVLTPMKVPDITSKVRIGIFKCVFCTKEFSSKKTKIQHERNVHSSEGIHECSVCHKIFASVQYLRDHSKVHSETSLYQCSGYDEDCNKMFRSSKDLKRHVRGVHTGEKPYECLVCGKRFSASSNLSEHKTLHSGVMKYECRTCNKRFRLSSTLRKHELKNSCFKM